MVRSVGWPPRRRTHRHLIEETHLMHRFPRRLALSAGLVAILAVSATGVSAAPAQHVVGHVYVNNNSAVHNTVAGFDRWSDGNLTPIAGSPFETGGAGVGSPVGSAGAIQMTREREVPPRRRCREQRHLGPQRPQGWLADAHRHRALERDHCRSASRSTRASSTSRTTARAAATTRASVFTTAT